MILYDILKRKFAGQKKPIIAMAHFPATPGSPKYDNNGGLEKIYETVYKDVKALIENGVKTVMFCNEGDRPYLKNVGHETTATMAGIIAKISSELNLNCFGTDVLWDPKAALALGKATGASFVREVFTGAYAGDIGIWNTNCGETFRYRKNIEAEDIALLFNINAEFASSLDKRDTEMVAKSVKFSSLADVICVSGPMTGMETHTDKLQRVKENIPDDTLLFANTGVNIENVDNILSVADGVVIGSHLKVDGNTWNPIDPKRVNEFMKKVENL